MGIYYLFDITWFFSMTDFIISRLNCILNFYKRNNYPSNIMTWFLIIIIKLVFLSFLYIVFSVAVNSFYSCCSYHIWNESIMHNFLSLSGYVMSKLAQMCFEKEMFQSAILFNKIACLQLSRFVNSEKSLRHSRMEEVLFIVNKNVWINFLVICIVM